jgi:ABC-type glycerol-3-phosphate transport system substrate-binding protein
MIQRTRMLRVRFLVLILTLVFVACGAPPPATTSAPPASAATSQATAVPAPVLTDIHGPDDLRARFNQDAGVPRIILLVSPT